MDKFISEKPLGDGGRRTLLSRPVPFGLQSRGGQRPCPDSSREESGNGEFPIAEASLYIYNHIVFKEPAQVNIFFADSTIFDK